MKITGIETYRLGVNINIFLKKISRYSWLVMSILFDSRYVFFTLRIALTATLSSISFVLCFILSIKTVQLLGSNQPIEIYSFTWQLGNGLSYCLFAFLVSGVFLMSSKLKLMQGKYIEELKLEIRKNVFEHLLEQYKKDEIEERAQLGLEYTKKKMKEFSLVSNHVFRASLGLTGIIPPLLMSVVMLICLLFISLKLTIIICCAAIPVLLYLLVSINKTEASNKDNVKVTADYNQSIKQYFEGKQTIEMLTVDVNKEYERSFNEKIVTINDEFRQGYWVSFTLFIIVFVGLSEISNDSMSIVSLVFYILCSRWFVSSITRTLNNLYVIALSREGCHYINESKKVIQ